jgi:hypothetical protein
MLLWIARLGLAAEKPAAPLDPATDAQAEYRELAEQIAASQAWFARVKAQAYHPQALIHPEDRDPLDVVLRRTESLLADIQELRPRRDLSALAASLAALRRQAEVLPVAAAVPAAASESPRGRKSPASVAAAKAEGPRYELYLKACQLRRRIAFANPLLDFRGILFVQRHQSANHMCDQFYGHLNKPGGGLFVLDDAFGEKPKPRNLLEGVVVESGRLRGRELTPGSFLSPELSFDGRTVLFAYTELKGRGWSPESSFHIFRVGADGRGLAQLTDGKWNDFDPCFLPDGRVAFISERRGGYLRCGQRSCPVYVLYTMNADGGEIAPLSYHETHEWQPSVDNDGKLVYTRWDYVDRDTNAAHHLWTCLPDGRDPRSYHGNYPVRREGRPWGEWDIRAIPDRGQRYVATAAAHHGQAYGSLVLIDQSRADDGAMSQVRRITPECPFPEAEGRGSSKSSWRYATAWPLSEKYFLCGYDAAGSHHGIYLVDCFGNKELLFRDAATPSISPIPLRPRPTPPVVPREVLPHRQGNEQGPPTGVVMVANVYDSDFPWPEGTKIAALRVIQLLPKTTPSLNSPRIGVAQQANARAVLGTVPVEADGSAHFTAPAGKPIYFQALDERGLAVQSMRSATYLQPGQRLVCQGCHERKTHSPPPASEPPLAFRRGPSPITPEARGSNPFNYAVLVQPVLDRHCVACHREKGAIDLSGGLGKAGGRGEGQFTRSYDSLAAKYGFYFHSTSSSFGRGGGRTTAGKFGAAAAPLLKYLDKGHYGVDLSAEDLRRITLWLDCNSDFFGAYHDIDAQRKGELVKPVLE